MSDLGKIPEGICHWWGDGECGAKGDTTSRRECVTCPDCLRQRIAQQDATISTLKGLLRELKEFYCDNECERWPEHQDLCKRTDQQLQPKGEQ